MCIRDRRGTRSSPTYISQAFCVSFTYSTGIVKAASAIVSDKLLFVIELIAVICGSINSNYLIMKILFTIRTNPVCSIARYAAITLKNKAGIVRIYILFYDTKIAMSRRYYREQRMKAISKQYLRQRN